MLRVLAALLAYTCWLFTFKVNAQGGTTQQWGYILNASSIWNRCNIVGESGDLVDCQATASDLKNGSWTMAFHENRAFITNFERNQTSSCQVSAEDHFLGPCISNSFYKSDFRPSDIQIIGDMAYILNGKELEEAFISACSINSGNLENCRDVWKGDPYPYMMNIFGDKVHLTFDNSLPSETKQIKVCRIDTSSGIISQECTETGPSGSQLFVVRGDLAYILKATFDERRREFGSSAESYGSEYQMPVFELQTCEYSQETGLVTNCEITPHTFKSPFSMRSNGLDLYVTTYDTIARCKIAAANGTILTCTTNTTDMIQGRFYDLVFNPATRVDVAPDLPINTYDNPDIDVEMPPPYSAPSATVSGARMIKNTLMYTITTALYFIFVT